MDLKLDNFLIFDSPNGIILKLIDFNSYDDSE